MCVAQLQLDQQNESGTLGMKFALDQVPLIHRIAGRTREKERWQ